MKPATTHRLDRLKSTVAARTPSTSGPLSAFEKNKLAREVILQEAQALSELAGRIPADLTTAAEWMVACRGSVIVIGIGKAGWIAQKLSASLASTGTRSHFVHPSEAMHGDLGRIGADDLVLALSNSGETAEMLQILPSLKSRGTRLISMTATADNSLARHSDLVLDYGQVREACPLGLAPTTSTTLMLGLGDALAMVAATLRKMQPQDFARHHPGGSLGRKLSNVEEIMRPIDECRLAQSDRTVREVYVQLAGPRRRAGAVVLTNDQGQLAGIFTDSDLARLLESGRDQALDQPIARVMTASPAFVSANSKAMVAVEILASLNISELPVVDEQHRPVGLVDVTDVVGLFPVKDVA